MAGSFFVNVGQPDPNNFAVDVLVGGAIGSALTWRSTARVDRAGVVEVAIPASDPKAALLQPLRTLRCWGLVGGSWQQIAAGVIDRIERRVTRDGNVEIVATGPDLLGELAARVPLSAISFAGTGAGVTLVGALTSLATATGAWSFAVSGTPPQPTVYGEPGLDPILATLITLSKRTRTHFYAVPGQRQVVFTPDWTPSGVRAIRAAGGDLAPETCAITELTQIEDAGEVVTAIRPFGAGNAEARLTIAATTRTAPAGYGVRSDSRGFSIFSTAAEAAYGAGLRVAVRQWTGITPLSSTAADMQTAANALFDEALLWLQQHEAPQRFYKLKIAGASALLRPMQTIRVVYRDPEQGIDINEDLYILEAVTEVGADGLRTVGLTVATVDRYPDSDEGELVRRLTQAAIYAAQPQLNANSYVLPFAKNLDLEQEARFRFRFDDDVWQLARVTFDFQILALESTVKSVAGESSTTNAGGGTTATSGSGGGTTATSSSTTDTAQTSSSGGGTTATSSSGGGTTATTSSGGGATPTTSNGGGAFVSSSEGDKSHLHTVSILDGTPGQLVFYSDGALYADTGGTRTINSNFANVPHSHTVSVPDHSHSVTVPSHSHDVTIPGHTHGVTIPNHTHSVTVPGHNHNVTVPNHTHDVTIPNHTHAVTPVVNTVYGIYRDAGIETFALSDLEYSLDGLTWFRFLPAVNGYTTLGDGWTRIDLTALLQEPITLRPANANNLLRLRVRRELTFVADHQLHRVQISTIDGIHVGNFGSSGSGDGQFNGPVGVAVDAGGNVYVVDRNNHRVQVFTTGGVFVRKWGSFGTGNGQFNAPEGIAVDAGGNVYVLDRDNKRVQVFTSAGTYLRKWGSAGSGNGQFNAPEGIAIDGGGFVYVTDNGNARVQVFTSAGTFVRKWGSAGTGDGQFSSPAGIAVDGEGYVYVLDRIGGHMQVFTSTGTFVRKRAGIAYTPYGLALSGRRLALTDEGDATYGLKIFSLAGAFLRGWGADGAADYQLGRPLGVAVAPALAGQRATIEAQLNVRDIIQAVALSR